VEAVHAANAAVMPEGLAAKSSEVLRRTGDIEAERGALLSRKQEAEATRATLRGIYQQQRALLDNAYAAFHLAEMAGQEVLGLEAQWRAKEETARATQGEVDAVRAELAGLEVDARFADDVDAPVNAAFVLAGQREVQKRDAEKVLADLRLTAGVLEERVRVGDAAKRRMGEIEATTKATQESVATFKTLEQAYKDAPLLILETVIPEVEDACNRLLAKVSSSGLRVALVTQKATKGGDKIADTLDVMVSDVDGERPYEVYSGGERFRVDFCLRVALAWVLLQRAGAPLETLIVDEGFGALDASGVAAFTAMLAAVSEMFSRTIVISHVPAMADAAQARLVVEKGEGGSMFRMEM
jgi:exonuclease SbcC